MGASIRVFFGVALAAAIVLTLGARDADAYLNYTVSEGSGACLTCHGDFRANPYLRLGVDQGWGTSLMDGHGAAMTDCLGCHTSFGQFYPTSTFQSGNATFDQSCLGCHGRFEDNPGLNSFESSGLRQHHWDAGITVCGGCHPLDSDPDLYMPVGEDVLPPNYDVNLSVVPLFDPCNPGGVGEDFAGDSGGLDNDGDYLVDGLDGLDSDCFPPPTTTTTLPPTTTTLPPTTTTLPPTTTTLPPTTTTLPPTTTTTVPPTTTTTTLPPAKKVTLCHKGKETISVGRRAARWHLRHGDTLGACPDDDDDTDRRADGYVGYDDSDSDDDDDGLKEDDD